MSRTKLWHRPDIVPDDEVLKALQAQQGEIPGGEPVSAEVESGTMDSLLVHRFYLTIPGYSYRLLSVVADPSDRDKVTMDLGYAREPVTRAEFESKLDEVLNSEDTWRLIVSLQEAAKDRA